MQAPKTGPEPPNGFLFGEPVRSDASFPFSLCPCTHSPIPCACCLRCINGFEHPHSLFITVDIPPPALPSSSYPVSRPLSHHHCLLLAANVRCTHAHTISVHLQPSGVRKKGAFEAPMEVLFGGIVLFTVAWNMRPDHTYVHVCSLSVNRTGANHPLWWIRKRRAVYLCVCVQSGHEHDNRCSVVSSKDGHVLADIDCASRSATSQC